MNYKGFAGIAGFLLVLSTAFSIYTYFSTPTIAYVRNQELVYGFQGYKEAQQDFVRKKEMWLANADTLDADFQRSVRSYEQAYNNLSEKEKMTRAQRLSAQEQQVIRYRKSIEEKIQAEDDQMMQAVLNQINSFVGQYSKEKGIDVMLGTTLSGNILYGKEEYDVTDDLLMKLNANYRGE